MSMSPIKIYVGTQIEQSLAVEVLTYSIRRHTQQPIQVMPLYQAVQAAGIDIPTPANPKLRSKTPFTFQRFAIPALCHYKGRAIYLDSDMLVLKDIQGLWSQPFVTADLLSVPEPPGSGRSPQYSVMLLNCAQLTWDIDQLIKALEQGQWTYAQFVLEMAAATHKSATLPAGWNDLERYDPCQTALIHYTDMPHQPWLCVSNPLADLWCEALLGAITAGVITREAVQTSVEKGWVRPSLLHQIDYGITDPQQLPAHILNHDQLAFSPPHVWQKYLRHSFVQGPRSRQYFNRTYAAFKSIKQRLKPKSASSFNI
jgi:hypothetical protein